MNLLQLRYFCAIAKNENMSQAAAAMNVAQSAMSKSLSLLEEELGVRLFDRVGKYLRLNEEGRLFYQQTAYALGLIDDATNRLQNPVGRLEGEVVVCMDSLLPYLPDLVRSFHEAYPHIQLQTAFSEDEKQKRSTGQFDVTITNCIIDKREKQESVLLKDEFVLLLPAGHPAATAKEVDLAEMRDEAFIYCCRTGDILGQRYDALCCMAGFTPHVFLIGADLAMATTMVHAKQGVSIIPASAIAALSPQMREGNALVGIRTPYYAQSIYTVTPAGKVKTPSAEVFLEYVQKYFARFYPDGVCGLNHRTTMSIF